MLQNLPPEIVLQVTDSLNADDIYSLSRIRQFKFLFHKITDDESMDYYYFNKDVISRSDVLISYKRYTSARLYLIEITNPSEFKLKDVDMKFQNARKVICLINRNPESSYMNKIFESFQKSFLGHFKPSYNTKFKFMHCKNVQIDGFQDFDYSLTSCEKCSTVKIQSCESPLERQGYRFKHIESLAIQDCSDEVIGNCNFESVPSQDLSITFKNKSYLELDGDTFMTDESNNYPMDINVGKALSVKFIDVDILKDLKMNSTKDLTLSFAEEGLLYVDRAYFTNLEKLSLIIKGSALPSFGVCSYTESLKHLSIQDSYESETSEIGHPNVLFGGIVPKMLGQLNSVTLELHNPRILKLIQYHDLSYISNFKVLLNEPIYEDLSFLEFQNLKHLSVGISNNCYDIPNLPTCKTLKSLEIVNGLANSNQIRISNAFKINEWYPNLQELVVRNINDGVMISNWFTDNRFPGLKSLKLLNIHNIPNLITLNECEFPDLESVEVNGIVNSMIYHELEISLKNSPKLSTVIVKIDELNEEFHHELSIWENYLHELNLKILDLVSLKNLVVNNINSVYLRNAVNVEKIIHGGDLDLQFLDADYLPNLQVLTYKNLNVARPIQSVNYINPGCVKKILKSSLHPLPDYFSV